MNKQTDNLELRSMEKVTNELVEYIYSKFHEFPDEEKWSTVAKLRNSANDLMFFVAQAAGNILPGSAEYEWINAHKNANSLRSMYIFATKQQYIDLDPGIVVKIDNLMKQIRIQSKEAGNRVQAANEKELAHWRKKYKIWKEISDEN